MTKDPASETKLGITASDTQCGSLSSWATRSSSCWYAWKASSARWLSGNRAGNGLSISTAVCSLRYSNTCWKCCHPNEFEPLVFTNAKPEDAVRRGVELKLIHGSLGIVPFPLAWPAGPPTQ